MKFSVIIPSFNQQEFLPDAIESALDQTRKPCEIIVVDDRSTDLSLEIARKYPVKVISQVNKGLAAARNTGIMNAAGDYVLPLDADDILMPNCLERIEDYTVDNSADIMAPSFKNFGILNSEIILHPQPTIELMTQGNMLPYFSAIKREALLECGGYSPRMTWGYEDYHLWFDLLSRGKTVVTIPEVLVLYRTKENSMLTEANKHRDELMGQIAKDFPSVWQK